MSKRTRQAIDKYIRLYAVMAPASKYAEARTPVTCRTKIAALKRMSWLRSTGNVAVLKVTTLTLGHKPIRTQVWRFGPELSRTKLAAMGPPPTSWIQVRL